MSRLFLAIWPPDDVVEELRSLRRKDQRGVRFVDPDSWHITLRFLGEAHDHDVITAMEGAPLPAVHVRLGPGVDVLSERALVVPAAGVDALAAEVTARTRSIGDPPPRRRFVGHLTLARLKPGAHIPAALGALVSGEWDVDEITLVSTRLDPAGARYDVIATWPTASI